MDLSSSSCPLDSPLALARVAWIPFVALFSTFSISSWTGARPFSIASRVSLVRRCCCCSIPLRSSCWSVWMTSPRVIPWLHWGGSPPVVMPRSRNPLGGCLCGVRVRRRRVAKSPSSPAEASKADTQSAVFFTLSLMAARAYLLRWGHCSQMASGGWPQAAPARARVHPQARREAPGTQRAGAERTPKGEPGGRLEPNSLSLSLSLSLHTYM